MLLVVFSSGCIDFGGEKEEKKTYSAVIHITSNSEFTSENSVTSGSGTESNPYIIEDLKVDASSKLGICIENTNAYFIIRNCVIHDGGDSHTGIYFYSVQNGKIENVTSYNNYDGIYLYYSSNNTITNCSVYNNAYYGICLGYSSNNSIISNTFTNDGIVLSGYLDDYIQTIENNTINGKPIYYFLNENGITLDNIEVGQLILVNCTNFIIKNLDISYTDVGIELLYSSNNQLTNCYVYNNYMGFSLDFSSNNTITNCGVYNNKRDGILMWYSSNNNLITNCSVYNNSNRGIWLYFSSNNNTIINCAIYSNNDEGISLWDSSDNEIHYNNIYDNTNYGVDNSDSEDEYQVDATNNWWGSVNGPGQDGANSVGSNVLYDPLLTEPAEGIDWTPPEGDEKTKGFIPGFETAIFLVAMIGVCVTLLRRQQNQ